MNVTRRKRIMSFLRQHKWQVVWALGVLLPSAWALRLLLGSPPVVTPSKDTTFLTGRTLPDGSLDFSAALWHHCNTPVNDADNAAILLRELEAPEDLLGFLNRYAMKQANDPEHSSEIFAAIAQEQGFDVHTHRSRLIRQAARSQVIRLPWTRKQFSAVAEFVDRDVEYVRQWKEAVNRPAISKPIGTTIDEIHDAIFRGAACTLARGMLDAGEGNWEAAIKHFESIDRAAEHLCQLQCGWMLNSGLDLRNNMTQSILLVLREVDTVPPRFAAWVRHRSEWSVRDIAINAIDNALRIRAQTYVRDIRNPEGGPLRSWLRSGLVGNAEARQIQVTQLRNSIDWETVASIQNDAIDELVELLSRGTLAQSRTQYTAVCRSRAERDPHSQMIDTIQQFTGEDITEPLARSIVFGFFHRRIGVALDWTVLLARMDRTAVFAVAIREFRQKHQRWPDTVFELPNQIDTIDPSTDEQFHYETSRSERFPAIDYREGWSVRLRL